MDEGIADALVSDGAANDAPGHIQVFCALRVAARGYILKGHAHKELLESIRAVHARHKCIPPDIAAELADHATDDALTEREIDALNQFPQAIQTSSLPISSRSARRR